MKLSKLIESIDNIINISPVIKQDIEITSIHYNSKTVVPGGLFIAIKGLYADGHNFIEEAILKGASAVIVQQASNINRSNINKTNAIIIKVKNSKKALAQIASCFYGNPSEKLCIIAITGTNGKTTTTYIIENILKKADISVGVIGTINYRYLDKTFPSVMTTPESSDLQKILHDMVCKGVTHVIMEVSSHSIEMGRIENCFFDIAVFTNLTQDHLDFHKNMESYWVCKQKLFTDFLTYGPKKNHIKAIINCNNKHGSKLLKALTYSTLSTGYNIKNDIKATDIDISLKGIKGTILIESDSFQFQSNAVGLYNLDNILSAAGVAVALGLSADIIKKGIEDFPAVPGRLEPITTKSGDNKKRFIFVDYAHTPDAMQNVLSTLKNILNKDPLSSKKLICIFGCGGDRDQTKRPQMGNIAYELSDLIIITSDNPRKEDPIHIINDIVNGLKDIDTYKYTIKNIKDWYQKKGYFIEPDRAEAIKTGIAISRPGDTILIAGKGHETYQIIGQTKFTFDDRVKARQSLDNIL